MPLTNYARPRLSDAEIEEIKARARAAAGLPPVRRPATVIQARETTRARRPPSGPAPKRITFKGKSLTVPEWAERLGINTNTLRMRFFNGWPIDRALSSPCRDQGNRAANGRQPYVLTYDGKAMTVREWADHLGIQAQVIHYRLRQGWPLPMVLDRRLRFCRSPNRRH